MIKKKERKKLADKTLYGITQSIMRERGALTLYRGSFYASFGKIMAKVDGWGNKEGGRVIV